VEGARSSDEGRLEGMPNSQEAAESYDAGPCSCHFLSPEPGLKFDDVYFQLFRQVVSLGDCQKSSGLAVILVQVCTCFPIAVHLT
jgi:hypothetical protein